MQSEKDSARRLSGAWRNHERLWRDNLYVYAVVSRRSRGISVGINLNPDKGCNFDCIYCQVNRRIPPRIRRVDLEKLSSELNLILEAEQIGSLYKDNPFNLLAPGERGIRDFAFSGDGEPTASPSFADALRIVADARRQHGLNAARIILITNAGYLDKPRVRTALEPLDGNNGEIWAKLDAGTEEYFRRVNRPNVPYQKILENILETSRIRPVVIQTLWFRIDGIVPPQEEVQAYCSRLNTLLSAGGRLKKIQLYTIARNPAEPSASSLSNEDLDRIAEYVGTHVPVTVETYYGN